MSARLFMLERYLPGPLRRHALRRLVRLTAEAFGVPPPAIHRLPHGEAVAAFARFTREQADRVLAEGNAGGARERLRAGARDMGASLRARLCITSPHDAIRALALLYRTIGIDLEGDYGSGEITIRRCAFSETYTPAVCALISGLDDGIAEGITGGATLVFHDRITAGAACCRASLKWSAPQ
jgi:hypothetical protein